MNLAIGELKPASSTRTQARPFAPKLADVLGQFVQPAPRERLPPGAQIPSTLPPAPAAERNTLNSLCAASLGHVVEFHAVAQVGLVGAVSRHRVGVAEPPERRPDLAPEQVAENARHHALRSAQ